MTATARRRHLNLVAGTGDDTKIDAAIAHVIKLLSVNGREFTADTLRVVLDHLANTGMISPRHCERLGHALDAAHRAGLITPAAYNRSPLTCGDAVSAISAVSRWKGTR